MLRIHSISAPRGSTANSCRCSWQIRGLTWCSLLWSYPMWLSGTSRALELLQEIGLGISHLFANNIQISLCSALWSATLHLWMILLPFAVGQYRFSLHLNWQPRPLLHYGVIPRRGRNQEKKDLILVKLEPRKEIGRAA